MKLDMKAEVLAIEALPVVEQRDRLIDLRNAVNSELADIRNQLTVARSEFAKTRQYADPDWYTSANLAARIKGQQLLRIQQLIAKLNIRMKAENVDRGRLEKSSFNAAFMRAVRRRLGDAVTDELIDEAKNYPHPA